MRPDLHNLFIFRFWRTLNLIQCAQLLDVGFRSSWFRASSSIIFSRIPQATFLTGADLAPGGACLGSDDPSSALTRRTMMLAMHEINSPHVSILTDPIQPRPLTYNGVPLVRRVWILDSGLRRITVSPSIYPEISGCLFGEALLVRPHCGAATVNNL